MPRIPTPTGGSSSSALRAHSPVISEAFSYYRAVYDEFTTLDPVLVDLVRLKSSHMHGSAC